MSRKLPIIVCALACAAAAKCPNYNQARDSKSLLQMEDFWVQALTDRSSTELDCLIAADFSDSNWKGEHLTRAQVLQAAERRAPVHAGAQHHFGDMSGRVFENTGIVSGLSYWTYADGSKHSIARFTDIFVYRDRRWLAVAGQETMVQEESK